ncbi:response regulator [Fibrivirga algicola]|uniref:Response regulator n=1 Tax=Fibrivirga algicola TaxID=2950420 RepID=A0ABX0QDG4_9BACT|nr:response regulator [Fibrivirga algicola]ARK13388.1 response regulator receiver protein [Fibrella sp. ES10-3-2-2]NID09002.1 response regulator [Fibrivirga algicola]
MNHATQTVDSPTIFIAVDQLSDHHRYRQAFTEAEPTATLYFFMHSTELIAALRSYVYPKPSLLIMDWDMDAHKGYNTLATLAQTTVWQTIPVVIMSKPGRPVDVATCRQIGYGLVLPTERQATKLADKLSGIMYALL